MGAKVKLKRKKFQTNIPVSKALLGSVDPLAEFGSSYASSLAADADLYFTDHEAWKKKQAERAEQKVDIRTGIREHGSVTDLHCPGCGKKGLMVEAGEGDYYQGPAHLCAGCDELWTLQ